MAKVLVLAGEDTLPVALMAARSSHSVQEVNESGEVLLAVLSNGPDVLVIPEGAEPIEGVELLPVVRRMSQAVITVVGLKDERREAQALLQGADIYLPVPVQPDDFATRLGATLRRYGRQRPVEPTMTMQLGEELGLTPAEEHLLRLLLDRLGANVPAQELLAEVWGDGAKIGALRIHMNRLRSKLKESPFRIENRRGVGYRLEINGKDSPAGPGTIVTGG